MHFARHPSHLRNIALWKGDSPSAFLSHLSASGSSAFQLKCTQFERSMQSVLSSHLIQLCAATEKIIIPETPARCLPPLWICTEPSSATRAHYILSESWTVHGHKYVLLWEPALAREYMAGGAFNTQVHPLIRFAAAAAACLASSSIKRRLHPHCNPFPPPDNAHQRQRAFGFTKRGTCTGGWLFTLFRVESVAIIAPISAKYA